MRPRLVIGLALVIALPLVVALWTGVRLAEEERRSVGHRFREALDSTLREVDARVLRHRGALEREIAATLDAMPADIDEVRTVLRRDGRLANLFRLDPEGAIVFPDSASALTENEEDFLARTKLLFAERFLHGRRAPEEATRIGGDPDLGWYAWHWENGVSFILWKRYPDGTLRGAELDRVRLLSDLVGLLPENPEDAAGDRIRLLDPEGRILYEWGGLDPAPEALPDAERPLSPPFHSWRLQSFAAAGAPSRVGGSVLFNILAGGAVLVLAAVTIGAWLYRESARESREAAERMDFVGRVSHELKTPLTNIRMYAELLEKRLDEDDAKSRDHLRIVVNESRRLGRLVTNVLTFARREKKESAPQMVPGRIDEAVAALMETFRPVLDEKGIAVETRLGCDEERFFDHDALDQILGNLVGNVEKYAATGRFLAIATRAEGDRAMITVEDRGPGIPAAMRERVFEPFVRLSDRLTDAATGTGIGLTIARDLARAHGGDLVIEPCETGARFVVTIFAKKKQG